jgi:hypothetical protein
MSTRPLRTPSSHAENARAMQESKRPHPKVAKFRGRVKSWSSRIRTYPPDQPVALANAEWKNAIPTPQPIPTRLSLVE